MGGTAGESTKAVTSRRDPHGPLAPPLPPPRGHGRLRHLRGPGNPRAAGHVEGQRHEILRGDRSGADSSCADGARVPRRARQPRPDGGGGSRRAGAPRRGGAVGRDVPQAAEGAPGRPDARRSEGVARGARRAAPRRRLDRPLPPRARRASLEDGAVGVDRAPVSRRRRRGVPRRDPHRARRAQPRGARDAGARARARRGARLLGGDLQRAARGGAAGAAGLRAPRFGGDRRGSDPSTRAARGLRQHHRPPRVRSTAFRPSRRWPTPSTRRAIRMRSSRT